MNIGKFHSEINKRGGGFSLWRVEFFKVGKRDFTFIREMRVCRSYKFLKSLEVLFITQKKKILAGKL